MHIKIFVFVALLLINFSYQLLADDIAPNQQLEGFNLNGYTNNGKKSWEINGDKADISDQSIKVTNVNANMYDEKQNANLKSKTGVIDKANGDVQLHDDVVVTADRGTTMTTDSLYWSRNKDLVKTDDNVMIQDEKGTLTGKGLVGHPNLKQAQLNQDVTATIKTNQSKALSGSLVQITCDGPMEVDQQKMSAVFNKNVVARELQTGRQLQADKMTIWFDDKQKKLKKVVCTGHVVATQGNNSTYADEMIYTGDDEKLIMTGRPKLIFDTGGEGSNNLFDKIGGQ